MIQPLDPFALNFDSIELDSTRAPSKAAVEHALALCAPEDELLTTTAAAPDFGTAGFFLLDDADGRFVVDREMGVVSLKDAALLESERGAVHGVRLRVVEPSGSSYEIELQLRLTGLVPQVVGAEEFAAIAGVAAEPAPTTIAPQAPPPSVEVKPPLAWSTYAIATATQPAASLGSEDAAFGALLSGVMPSKGGQTAFLTLGETLPPPAARHAAWTL